MELRVFLTKRLCPWHAANTSVTLPRYHSGRPVSGAYLWPLLASTTRVFYRDTPRDVWRRSMAVKSFIWLSDNLTNTFICFTSFCAFSLLICWQQNPPPPPPAPKNIELYKNNNTQISGGRKIDWCESSTAESRNWYKDGPGQQIYHLGFTTSQKTRHDKTMKFQCWASVAGIKNLIIL